MPSSGSMPSNATVPRLVARATNDAKAWSTNHQTAVELGRDPERDSRQQHDPLLDRPSDRSTGKIKTTDSKGRPVIAPLDSLMNDALLQIYLTGDGATSSPTPRISRGAHNESRAPSSGLAEEVERLQAAYFASRTHRMRLTVIKEAQATVTRIRYAPTGTVLFRGTREWRRAIATDPRPRRVVAADFGVSSKTITAAKKEFGIGA